MSVTLYHHEAGSTCSQKVKLCLHHKGIAYKSVNIDLRKNNHQSPDYLEINRHGLVPTLTHNENIIVESSLINEYLDRVFPEKPLLPTDPLLIYQVQYSCKRQEYMHEQCFRYLSYQYSERANTLTHEQIQNHTQLDRRRFLRNLKQGLSDHDISEIETFLIDELYHIDEALTQTDWICGNMYTLADISWTATIYRLEQLGKLDFLHTKKMHHLLSWYEKVKSLDNFCGYNF